MIRLHKIENSFFESNTFILWTQNNDKCVIVDCGDSDSILKFVEINHLNVESILLTHGHYDHIYGINDLLESYPNVKIYGSKHTLAELKDSKLNYSLYHEKPFTVDCDMSKFVDVSENDIIPTFDNSDRIEIIATPGHDSGCLTYIHHDYIFTGDSYIPGLRTVTNLRGDKQKAIESENKIKELISQRGLIVCPGHGEISNGLLTSL